MPTITTFDDLIAAASSEKVLLVEVQPKHLIEDWTLVGGDVYRRDVGAIDVTAVTEDGTAMTEVGTTASISAGTWTFDDEYIYAQATSGAIFAYTTVATYKMYFGSSPKVFNSAYYEPRVKSVPDIVQAKTEPFWAVSIISSGKVVFDNEDYFDDIYSEYAWENQPVAIKLGGEELPYSEYATLFDGTVTKKELGMQTFTLHFEDSKRQLESSLPSDLFDATTYPNIDPLDVGKAIPLVWGTCYNIPVICTNRADTATSVYSFKVANTSTHSISDIDTVRVNGIAKTVASEDTTTATFTLAAANYTSGDTVTADVDGYLSGTTLLENPVDVLREVTALLGHGESDWDTSGRATAHEDAEDFVVGLYVDSFVSSLDHIASLMRSCMGTFYVNNEGQLAITIWKPDLPTSADELTEVDVADLSAESITDHIRKTVRCGIQRDWYNDSFSWRQSSSDTTEAQYGITRSRSVQTLLSDADGAELWLQRMQMIYESSKIMVRFRHKLALASYNIGDRFQVSFKRNDDASDFSWLNGKYLEILEIRKNFLANIITIIADDLKGIGANVGHWTADPPSFPDSLGGAAVTAWSDAWTSAQKAYALENWGFWTDANGLIDPTDGTTKGASKWW